jgi:thioredoxin-related protein
MIKLITLLAICFTTFSFQFASAVEENPASNKSTSLEQAFAKAKQQAKPVMLIISSKGCASYRNFTNKVLSDSAIVGLYGRNFILHTVDADTKEGKKLAYKYNAMVLPTIIYFSADKEIIFRSHGGDKPAVAAEEATKVIKVMQTHKIVRAQALKMRNISYLNKKVQKKVAVTYAKKDATEGRTDIEKQVFEYTLNSSDLKFFNKTYVKSMNKYK